MRTKWLLGLLCLISFTVFAEDCQTCNTCSHCPDLQDITQCHGESWLYTIGQTVTTSPLIGIRSAYDAQDLIVNLSTMNEDLRFLQQRCKLKMQFGTAGLPCARRPILEISGDVIGSIYWAQPFVSHSVHDINLNGARLDFFAEVGNWAFGYVSLDYDNTRLSSSISGFGQRISNSNVFLKRGFLTIGDLTSCPVYFSLGQMFVPFGRYSSYIVTSTLTSALAQTNARAALLGAYYDGGYASVYAFTGDSDVASTGINQWGFNVGYEFQNDCVAASIGAGYIGNIADSNGMQKTDAYFGFQGFGENLETEMLVHRVPAIDFHGEFGWKCVGLNVEYITTTRHFAGENLSYNDEGAGPGALHLELDLRVPICEHPFAFALAYGRTWEALGLNLPKDSYVFAVTTAPVKNTLASIEYRHDCNYSETDTAGGSGADPVNAMGSSRNSVVGQIGIYF